MVDRSSAYVTLYISDFRFSLETNTPYCYFDNLKVKDTKYCGLGNWQFGYQEDEKFSNLFEENFCCKYI